MCRSKWELLHRLLLNMKTFQGEYREGEDVESYFDSREQSRWMAFNE